MLKWLNVNTSSQHKVSLTNHALYSVDTNYFWFDTRSFYLQHKYNFGIGKKNDTYK